MKNTYKWRANNIKYVYITDVDGKGPFIYNKSTGVKTFLSHTETSDVNEDFIKNYVSHLSFADYSAFFQDMIALCQTDSDCANIVFADVAYYYNTDGDECQENPPAVPCECYIPKWVIDGTETIPYDQPASAVITNTTVITSTREIIYHLKLYIPQGKDGVTPPAGPMGPQGETGADGQNAQIDDVIVLDTETLPSGETAQVEVITAGTHQNMTLYLKFSIPQGDKGETGDRGETGDDGADAYVRNVMASAVTLNPSTPPYVIASSDTFYDEERNRNVTDMNFTFGIPQGEQGVQGETGPAAKFADIGADVYTIPYDQPATVQVISGTTNVVVDNVVEQQYVVKFVFEIPQGMPGEVISGDTPTPSGGMIYDFNNPVYWDYVDDRPNVAGIWEQQYDVVNNLVVMTLRLKKPSASGLEITGDDVG